MSDTPAPAAAQTHTRVHTDPLAPWPSQAMLGLLDRDPHALSEGDPLPLGWHWLYFKQPLRASRLAHDGHETRGTFMPDVDLPRRMWAGGTLRSLRPVSLGESAELRSKILSVSEKTGKSGRLVFVTVGHTVLQRGRPCVKEEQVIVYREPESRAADSRASATAEAANAASRALPPASERYAAARRSDAGGGPAPEVRNADGGEGGGGAGPATDVRDADRSGKGGGANPVAEWTESFLPTTVTLFQFSALTYNGHRIHYDHPYVTEKEGYPGLLVHGPLNALLLLDAAQRHSPTQVTSFRYRALAPLFVDEPITLVGHPTTTPPGGADPPPEHVVEVLGPSGEAAMRAWVG